MAEIAVSLARENLLPLLKEEANLLWNVPKEFADIKVELEHIQAFLMDADQRAASEGDEGVKVWVKQLREVAFRIEDVTDEYMIYVEQQPRDPGCVALLCDIVHFVETLIHRHQVASEIGDIKSTVVKIKQRSKEYRFQIQPRVDEGPSSQSVQWHDPRRAACYLDEAEVVGFEGPRDELIGWLIEGPAERTVVYVVGAGGQGKTTLANRVYKNQQVVKHFDCHAWITVSRSYSEEGLLRDMLNKFCKGDPPKGIFQMNQDSLIEEVRKCLQEKRYVVVFDDVWDVSFWSLIENVVFDNKIGSRILITTRKMSVANSCKNSPFGKVHELKPLTPEKSLELFCKKAFQFDYNGCCPEYLEQICSEIVKKCEGLPLAIVAIGGLLSDKDRDAHHWEKFSQNLSVELEENSHLVGIIKILGFSYDDLPHHLKPCLLYFGIYPEDYVVDSVRLIRQWIAEGFVKSETENGKTLEEVAEQYLTELIHRSLVQVSSLTFDGKTKSCRVHDLVRKMIHTKVVDLSFCHFVSENVNLTISDMIRRLTIATSSNNLVANVQSSHTRSLHVFRDMELPESFVGSIPKKYRLLKILDFEDTPLNNYVPQNLGDLFHVRYLSFRNTKITNLPESIGTLHNLETLDLRQTMVREMPREINKFKKLRHLLAYDKSKAVGFGIQMKGGIGDLTSLQTLREVEADHGGVELIETLERLTLLRVLGLTNVRQEFKNVLCSSMSKMQLLEKLYVAAINEDEDIDLDFDVSAPELRKLNLVGKLSTFPDWVAGLQSLVKLSLSHSKLTHDPLTWLKDLPNLLYLSILYRAYEGESFHFQAGGFRNLKQVVLRRLYNLNSIIVDEEALPSLKKFMLVNIPQLMEVPNGIYNLPEIEVFHIVNMPDEFEESIDHSIERPHWIIEKVPFVNIKDRFWP